MLQDQEFEDNGAVYLHLTSLLCNQLHWLRARQQITFKQRLLVYKVMNGLAHCLSYMKNLCAPATTVSTGTVETSFFLIPLGDIYKTIFQDHSSKPLVACLPVSITSSHLSTTPPLSLGYGPLVPIPIQPHVQKKLPVFYNYGLHYCQPPQSNTYSFMFKPCNIFRSFDVF